MQPLAFDTVIVRFGGEIGIKAPWTRKQYERRLTHNIRAALKHHAISCSAFIKIAGRLYIKTERADETAERLSRVFGVSSSSPALELSSNLDSILNASVQLAASRFKPKKSFAVRCHRVGKHSYTSQEVCAQIGERLLTSLPKMKLRVNLTQPEQTMQVEVREEKAYLFIEVVKGSGGLPLGTQPKLVCLLKGDVESATAIWMTMKRGCPAVLVHFVNADAESGPRTKEAVVLARKLMKWNIGFPQKLYVIELKAPIQNLVRNHSYEYGSILWKRLMLRTVQRLAETTKAEGIVTGDSLGISTTQTLRAYRLQDEAIKGYPIYRPLLGLNSAEIEETAKKIGLLETTRKAIKPKGKTSEISVAAIRSGDIKQTERKMNVESITDSALQSIRIIKL